MTVGARHRQRALWGFKRDNARSRLQSKGKHLQRKPKEIGTEITPRMLRFIETAKPILSR